MITLGLKKFIESNALALASLNSDGTLHNIAVAYVKVEDGNKVIVSNAHIFQTIKNIKQNSNVSLVVWNNNWEKACVGYELIGKAVNYNQGKWFEYAKKLPDNEGYNIVSAIVIEIEKIKELKS